MAKWKKDKKKSLQAVLLGTGLLLVAACWQGLEGAGDAPALVQMWEHFQNNVYVRMLKTYMPVMTYSLDEDTSKVLFREYMLEKLTDILPVYGYTQTLQEYETQVESEITYEMVVAWEGVDENYKNGELVINQDNMDDQEGDKAEGAKAQQPEAGSQEIAQDTPMEEPSEITEEPIEPAVEAAGSPTEPVVKISLDKLNDFDYLIQNFYQVDRTTTINSSQLNAQNLLEKDMSLAGGNENPQILIYHTHSQENYTDSNGDASTSIVGVGDYLARLLQDNYGFNVIHHTGEYDVVDRDNAYSYAGPALEQILAENPSIEVVIDLHRDGVNERFHPMVEVNGKQTAMIMFFNGLSRTTANGDIAYLPNPYIEDNLAFSFQMKLMAEQYYPGFARGNYLKGYRYNLHYRPKSLLVEVGAQTNSVQEAMNAMEPLADLLHKVLIPEQ